MTKIKTVKASELHAKDYASDAAYRKAYEDLEEEYALIGALIGARTRANLSQAQLAERMNTTQAAIGGWRAAIPCPGPHAEKDRQGNRA